MEIQVAAAKVNKYAVSESGDTLEIIERPSGGLSVVLADGQSSGHGAKAVSMMVVSKIISLISEGVRDGAAARAASDFLYTSKKGKVSCTLNMISIDLFTRSVVLTRNNPVPFFIATGDKIECQSVDSMPLGIHRETRPIITEFDIEPGLIIVAYTDGLVHAGARRGNSMDVCTSLNHMLEDQDPTAQEIADSLLAEAMRLDENRPADDISVVVFKVLPHTGDDARRMSVRLPIRI